MRNSKLGEMPGLLEKGLDCARTAGASSAKISFDSSESVSVGFENGRLKGTGSRQSLSYSIDVIVGGLRGTTRGNDPGDITTLVERAIALARVGSVAHFPAFPQPKPFKAVRLHSPATAGLSLERMISSCQEISDALKAHDPGLYIEASANRSESEGMLATSGGIRHTSRETAWYLSGSVQRTDGTDMLFAGEGRYWRELNGLFDPSYIISRTITDLKRSEKTVEPPPSGQATVILSPDLTAQFLTPLIYGISGRSVAKGESPLKGRIGEKILDESLAIMDDPHRDFDGNAAEIDGDGIPTAGMDIIANGVLRGFLYDLDSAGLAGAEPTGHNGCHPYSLVVAPGKKSRESLFAGVSDGLYLKSLIGFGQSNMMNGDVSGNVGLGFRIRNGELAGRVKNTMIAGNIYSLLKSGVEVSLESDPVSRMPYLKLSGVSISSSAR